MNVTLNELGLKQEAVVRVCKLGYVSRSGKPVGKRLRFVRDSEEFVKPLRGFQACRCKEHAHLNDVNWNETGKYNKSLALALCNAAYTCARAGGHTLNHIHVRVHQLMYLQFCL